MDLSAARVDRSLRAVSALVAGVVLLAPGSAFAEDLVPPVGTPARIVWPTTVATVNSRPGSLRFDPAVTPNERQGYLDELFVPRLRARVGRLGAGDLAVFPGERLDEQIFFETLNERAYAGLEHAAGRALRQYVQDHTSLGQMIDDLGDRVAARTPRALRGRSLSVDVFIAHMTPGVVLRPRLGEGKLGFSVNAAGTLGVRYRNDHLLGGTRIGAKVDPLDRSYTLSCLIGF